MKSPRRSIATLWAFVVALAIGTPAYTESAPQVYLDIIRSRSVIDVLSYVAHVQDDCQISVESVTEMVDGVFIRSRIEPLEGRLGTLFGNLVGNFLFLSVSISCIERASASNIFSVSVEYSAWVDTVVWSLIDYGTFGVGTTDFILSSTKTAVEDAITDFIRAHRS